MLYDDLPGRPSGLASAGRSIGRQLLAFAFCKLIIIISSLRGGTARCALRTAHCTLHICCTVNLRLHACMQIYSTYALPSVYLVDLLYLGTYPDPGKHMQVCVYVSGTCALVLVSSVGWLVGWLVG